MHRRMAAVPAIPRLNIGLGMRMFVSLLSLFGTGLMSRVVRHYPAWEHADAWRKFSLHCLSFSRFGVMQYTRSPQSLSQSSVALPGIRSM